MSTAHIMIECDDTTHETHIMVTGDDFARDVADDIMQLVEDSQGNNMISKTELKTS